MTDKGGKPFLKGLIIGIVATAIAGGLLAFFLSPLLLKHRTDWPFEVALGTNRVLAAIPGSDKRTTNPLEVTADNVAKGAVVYTGNCAMCHGADGRADTPIGRNMYPEAADLTSKRVTDMTDGEIAWITRNGISFVGMPSFRELLSDEQIWQTVLYIHELQQGRAGGAESTAAAAATSEGKDLFAAKSCASCHGANAEGGIGPRLAGTDDTFDEVLGTVRRGEEQMPAFSADMITDDQVRTIFDWLEKAGS